MKKILFILIIIGTNVSFSQQAIGTNAPDASAALDITSTNKGVLIPRIALTGNNDVTTITTPQTSLLVYNTATVVGVNAITPGFHYFDGTQWIFIRDATQGNDTTNDFWIDSTYVRGGNTIMQIRDNGNVEIGLSNKIEIINRQISSGGTGLRELFRVSNNKLATSGIFSIASTRANFVHSSNWSWTSNHQTVGKGMLTKLSGSDYVNNVTATNIPVYIDVASNGDAIISADWNGNQTIDISILKLSGGSIDLTNTGTLWSSPNAGYIRADSVFTREHAFQTRDGLFSGNVGVGLTKPTSKLHVYDTINNNTAVRVDAGKKVARFSATALDSSDNYIGLEMGVVGANDAAFSYYGQPERAFIYSSASANGLNIISQLGKSDERIAFYSGKNANANPDMVIVPSGNVGIGEVNPQSKLVVRGNYDDHLTVGDTNQSGGIRFVRNAGQSSAYIGYEQTQNNLMIKEQSGNGDIYFVQNVTGTGPSLDTTVYFEGVNGNVGIGTITPSRKLEVAGDINVGLNITPLVANSYGNRLYFGGNAQNTDDLWMARYNRLSDQTYLRVNIGDNTGGGEDAFQIGNGTFATPFLHVNNLGRVGIGTTTPTEKLHVNGEARIQTITDTTAAIHVLTSNANGVIKKIRVDSIVKPSGGSSSWALTGNAGTNSTTNFIGTTDAQALSFRVNNIEKVRIESNGTISTLNTGRSVFIGQNSGINDDLSANENVFIGYNSGLSNTSGNHNVAIGPNSFQNNTTGSNSVSIGTYALSNNTFGNSNIALGYRSLAFNTSGSNNIANGYNSLSTNSTGSSNIALGAFTLERNTTGSGNIALGISSLRNNTTGFGNIAIGENSMNLNITGLLNIAIGRSSLSSNTSGLGNSSVGFESLNSNTTGNHNVALGRGALKNNTTGYDNVGTGYTALGRNTDGYRNTASGSDALGSNMSGINNAAFGVYALRNVSSGSNNSALGYQSFNTAMTFSNSTALGANSVINASNKIRLGDATVTVVEGPVAYTISDGRFKSNIKEEVKGLDFILNLRPVVYNFETKKFDEFLLQTLDDSTKNEIIKSKDYTESTAIRQSGFIAQEVEEAAKNAKYNFNGLHKPSSKIDNYSLSYSQFVVPLVKATQEQQAIIKSQEERIDKLEKELQEIKALLLNKTDK